MTWTVGTPTASNTNAAATNTTFTAPTGTASGDTLIAWIVACPAGDSATDAGQAVFPGGWSILYSAAFVGNFHSTSRITIAMKTATSGDVGANYSVSWTNSAQFSWLIVNITPSVGASVTLDQVVDNIYATGVSITTITAPALSGLSTSSDLWIGTWCDCGGQNPYTAPGGPVTVINNNNQGSTNFAFLAAGYTALSSNSSLAQSFTNSVGSYNDGISIALQQTSGTVSNIFTGWFNDPSIVNTVIAVES